MKLVFMGTPEFSVFFLDHLMAQGHEISLVVTQPDRPSGRGRKPKAPAVKERALELGLEVYQPENLKAAEVEEKLRELETEFFIVVAYSILPKNLLAIPKRGSMNIHTSLLPKYRGAAPIQWALAKGEYETGLSFFLLDEKMDHGPLVEQSKVSIELEDNAESIYQKFLAIGGEALDRALTKVQSQNFEAIQQDHSLACPAPKLKKEDGLLDWTKSTRDLHNLIRGFSPWPCGYSFLEGKIFKILRSIPFDVDIQKGEGGVLRVFEKKRLIAASGDGWLELLTVQPEGKKAMDAVSFINGLKTTEDLCLKNQV